VLVNRDRTVCIAMEDSSCAPGFTWYGVAMVVFAGFLLVRTVYVCGSSLLSLRARRSRGVRKWLDFCAVYHTNARIDIQCDTSSLRFHSGNGGSAGLSTAMSTMYDWFTNIGILCLVSGNLASIIMVTTFILMLIERLLGLLSVSTSPASPLITLFVPGLTVPWSQCPAFLVSFLLAVAVHEAGHAWSAYREQVTVRSVGVFVAYYVLPGAYVNMDQITLNSLHSVGQMRIIGAGIAANLLLTACCGLVLTLLPYTFAAVGYIHLRKGVVLMASLHPLLPIGSAVTRLNGIKIGSIDNFQMVAESGLSNASIYRYHQPQLMGHTVLDSLAASKHGQQIDWQHIQNNLYAAEGRCVYYGSTIPSTDDDLQSCCYDQYFHESKLDAGDGDNFLTMPGCVLVNMLQPAITITSVGNVTSGTSHHHHDDLFDVQCARRYSTIWTGVSPHNGPTQKILRGRQDDVSNTETRGASKDGSMKISDETCIRASDCPPHKDNPEKDVRCVRPVFDFPVDAWHFALLAIDKQGRQQEHRVTVFEPLGNTGQAQVSHTSVGKYQWAGYAVCAASQATSSTWSELLYMSILKIPELVTIWITTLWQANISLAVINSLPVFAMDGHRACTLLLSALFSSRYVC
jgi:hypothetical protein